MEEACPSNFSEREIRLDLKNYESKYVVFAYKIKNYSIQ
jgi:hypothetical protein